MSGVAAIALGLLVSTSMCTLMLHEGVQNFNSHGVGVRIQAVSENLAGHASMNQNISKYLNTTAAPQPGKKDSNNAGSPSTITQYVTVDKVPCKLDFTKLQSLQLCRMTSRTK